MLQSDRTDQYWGRSGGFTTDRNWSELIEQLAAKPI